jgi:uncharacterized protein (DUF305 family)
MPSLTTNSILDYLAHYRLFNFRKLPMTSKFRFSPSVLAAAALTFAFFQPVAWSQSAAQPAGAAGMDGKNMDMKGMDNKGMDMKAMMKSNDDKMAAMKMTGKPDVDFAMMMRIHHQGAIDMAQAELRDGKDAQMRKLATSIISAQKKEIAQLDKFLAKNGHDQAMGK